MIPRVKTNRKVFIMCLDDRTSENIDKLIKREKKHSNNKVSRNEIINVAYAILNNDWLETKRALKMNKQ